MVASHITYIDKRQSNNFQFQFQYSSSCRFWTTVPQNNEVYDHLSFLFIYLSVLLLNVHVPFAVYFKMYFLYRMLHYICCHFVMTSSPIGNCNRQVFQSTRCSLDITVLSGQSRIQLPRCSPLPFEKSEAKIIKNSHLLCRFPLILYRFCEVRVVAFQLKDNAV